MSENRQVRTSPREVPNQDTVATRLADLSTCYVKYVGDKSAGVQIPVAVRRRHAAGPGMSETQARVLDWAVMNRGASVAASNLARGAMSKKTDAEKVEYLTKYLNSEYQFTDDLGSEFNTDLLHLATTRVVEDMTKGKNYLPKRIEQAVSKILSDPSVADKYTDRIKSEVAAILAERKPMQKRSSKSEDEGEEIEV